MELCQHTEKADRISKPELTGHTDSKKKNNKHNKNTKSTKDIENINHIKDGENDESICFICLDNGDLKFAKICCGITVYHQNCLEKYYSGLITDKKKISCQICHKNITNRIDISQSYTISYDKVMMWSCLIIWASIIISSCVLYAMLPYKHSLRAGFIVTYIFSSIISFYMMLNGTPEKTDILYETNVWLLFIMEIVINPLILICTSIAALYYPHTLGYKDVNYIFIGIGWGSIFSYLCLRYLYKCLLVCISCLPAIIVECCCNFIPKIGRTCCLCSLYFTRSCCMDDKSVCTIKGEYMVTNNTEIVINTDNNTCNSQDDNV